MAAAGAAAPALALWGCAAPRPEAQPPATLHVGPTRATRTLAEAARHAPDGAVIEVDPGDYRADTAVWTQRRLSLRAGPGGRVRLLAEGAAAEGKAIWVVRGGSIDVTGFSFEGCRVPARNGAGIRFERGRLTVRACRFIGNEMGLLTGNDPSAELTVENSEFAHNRRDDGGHNHNLYAGTIGRLAVRGCWLHHATIGHLLKSRAALNHIYCNRLTDEDGGTASYELEFPNGGVAVVAGNVIQQGPATDNPIMLSYGAEGYRWPSNALALVHNTLVDRRPEGGRFLRVMPGGPALRVQALNNLLAGAAPGLEAGLPPQAELEQAGNIRVPLAAFADAETHDYRPLAGAVPEAEPTPAEALVHGMALAPTDEYAHPCSTRPVRRTLRRPPGALLPLRGPAP